ncbi:MAG: efflux RND transporter permease subunit [Elusimicrobiota bacterium]
MIRMFVKRPAMTLMFVLVFVVMGIVSFSDLIIEETPKMNFPMVTVMTFYSGASPSEIETQIIKKLEDAIAEISQIESIDSYCYENYGMMLIEFEMSADVNLKAIEVKDKIEPVTNELPRDADKPVVSKFDPTVEPIVDLILSGKDIDTLKLFEYADKRLRNQITVIEGVASVDIYGGKERQINVKLDNQLMNKYFTSINDIVNTVSDRNMNVPGGYIEGGIVKENVRFLGEFKKISDIADMPFVSREGKTLKISDVGTVEDSYKKVETYTRYNGSEVVGLSVKKLSDGDAVSIVREVREVLKKIERTLPEGMKLSIAYDSTTRLIKDTKNTLVNIIIGILLTVVILFLFLENLRVTFIAAVVIPTSLISAFFPMQFSGFTINFITLLAIATSLGTLIANALVVIESVDRELSKGKSPQDAAIDGTQGAMVAVLASAGTNLVVFTPIAVMGGLVGQFMRSFGLTVIYATIFSILASFSLTPMLCGLLLKRRDHSGENGKGSLLRKIFLFPQRIQKWALDEYGIIFRKILRHPGLTILISIIIFISAGYPLRYIGSEFMPKSDMDVINVNIELPQGAVLERTVSVVEDMEKIVSGYPEVKDYLSYIGIDGAENGKIAVNLIPSEDRERSDADLINAIIPQAARIPGATITLTRGGGHGGFGGDISINLAGTDYDRMIKMSGQMMDIMMKTGNFRSVESSYKSPKDEIRFIPDAGRMIEAGAFNAEVGDAISFAVKGHNRNLFKEEGEEYNINFELAEEYKEDVEDIKNISVMTKDGLLSVSELGDIVKTKGYSMIRRHDKSRIIQVNGWLSKSTAGQVEQMLNGEFKKIEFPENYRYDFVGMQKRMAESAREILKAFILAVIFTYMLLVSIMNSFKYPFVILTTVLTSFVGVFLILFFMEFPINIGAMMAMVMIVGLVVNNAILMLDYALHRMGRGDDVKDALWKGASVKFRAILMTSLAIVFGALPQIFDKFVGKASIGAVVIGGILASIFFTFFLVPAVFYVMTKKKKPI